MADRRVEFLVLSDTVPLADLVGRLGRADREIAIGEPTGVRASIAPESSWVLVESGDDDRTVDELLGTLIGRVQGQRETLRSLAQDGCTCILRIVARFRPDDRSGPGFAVDEEVIALLADLGAFLDVDQYVYPNR